MTPNQRMSEAWNGPESVHYVDHADRHDRQLASVSELLLDRAAIEPHHTVLDIGCGCGAIAITVASGARRVVGVDISDPLVRVAAGTAGAAGAGRVEFVVADAQIHPFDDGEFDVVISQFGLMFFDDPAAAFSNVRRALAPGGRLVFSCWQGLESNEWLAPVARAVGRWTDLPDLGGLANGGGMFGLKHDHEIEQLLRGAGFDEIEITSEQPPLLIGGGGSIEESEEFLLGLGIVRGLLGRLDDDQRATASSSIRGELAEHHEPGVGVSLRGGVWLVTASG